MSVLERLAKSAARIADLHQAKRAEMDIRDSLICEAINGGERFKAVSHASRRSIGTVAAIVGRGDPLDPERQEAEVHVFATTR
jgi:hypothetical protein